jgi:RimJ/RimL family protein N-acetyltransferase
MPSSPLPPVTLEAVQGEAAVAVAAMLREPALRAALYGGRGNVPAERAAAVWCDRSAEPRTLRRAVRCGVDGPIAGAVALVEGEVSYFIAAPFRGAGFGRAALRALLQDAPACRPLGARTVRENLGSRRLLQALEFTETGLQRQPDGLPCLVRYRRAGPI